MFKRACILFFIFFLFFQCTRDFSTFPIAYEEFFLEYNISGGIAGENNTLTINKNGSVFYTNRFYNISSIFNEKKLKDIYSVLINNDFFKLDTQYLPDQPIMDDLIFTITYQSSSKSKTIIASGYCSDFCRESKWPKQLHIIVDYFAKLITALIKNINSGKVTVTSSMIP